MQSSKSILDLPKADAFEFLAKQDAYNRANGAERAPLLLELLIFAHKKLGTLPTMEIIRRETKTDTMTQRMLLLIVQRKCE